MPGANCSIYGCSVSRRREYKGISLFKVPAGNNDFDKDWRTKLISVITKDRVIDESLRTQISKNNLYICERHFGLDQFYRHDTKATLNPGAVPTINLPQKSHTASSTITRPRDSAFNINQKKLISTSTTAAVERPDCYKSFDDFKTRVSCLKLNSWQVSSPTANYMSFYFYDQVHSVPNYEIYVDESLNFTIRCLLWSVPATHDLYKQYEQSVKNVTISSLISDLSSYKLCPGLLDKFAGSCIEHIAPRIFTIHHNVLPSSSPLFQSKWYRPPVCCLLIYKDLEKCSACEKVEKQETLSLKRKRNNLNVPAKLKAPIMLTSPERVKLTIQGLRMENKQLQEELVKLRAEIHHNSVSVNETLGDDLVKIMSGADKSNVPPFMKMFWEEQQKYISSSKKGFVIIP